MTLGLVAQDVIKVRYYGIATSTETDPNRPMVIGNHSEIPIPRCFCWELLSDQWSVEESMDTLGVSKPDISFTIHQLCHLKRVHVIGFGSSGGRFGLDIRQAVFWKTHHDGLIRGGDPDTIVSINHLKVFVCDRVSR